MRILFVSREYPPESNFGGIGSYVASIAPALKTRGHDVHVLSCLLGQTARDYEDNGVMIHRRPLRRIKGLGRLMGLPASTARVSAALSVVMAVRQLGTDFDIVEIPDYLAEGLFISMTRRVPTVAFLHTPISVIEQYSDKLNRADRWLADRLERLAVSHSELVTSPTQRLVDVLPDGWLKQHVPMIIRLPIDLESWAGTGPVVDTRPVVAHIGRLEPRKAPETLVQAAAILAGEISGFEAWFLGASGARKDGMTYQEWLEMQSEELSAPSKFWGYVPREELPRHLDRIRVVAITSREDNFPMAGIEAMAAGRPIVCMSTVGLAEILDGTEAGAIVPPDDPEALASALLPFLEDRRHAGRAGQAAKQLVTRVCAADVVASHREVVYERAIARASALR